MPTDNRYQPCDVCRDYRNTPILPTLQLAWPQLDAAQDHGHLLLGDEVRPLVQAQVDLMTAHALCNRITAWTATHRSTRAGDEVKLGSLHLAGGHHVPDRGPCRTVRLTLENGAEFAALVQLESLRGFAALCLETHHHHQPDHD